MCVRNRPLKWNAVVFRKLHKTTSVSKVCRVTNLRMMWYLLRFKALQTKQLSLCFFLGK